ncbi:roundabout homolog 4 [Erythrolamprus reginae]|uniref:roundabout homolog 4 n=1 Tax=Erythrolamprus reginae TaxID=121349 RepID=UPI00396CFA08
MSRRKHIEPSRLWIWASFLLMGGSRSRSMEFAPQILDHPSNLVVRKDQPATLNCRADGNPAPTIEWYRNGKYVKPSKDDAASQPTLLPDGSLFFLRLSQEKGKSDEGVYHCLARNHLGKAMSRNASLYLEVLEEEFRLHPSDLKVTTGESWLLDCVPPLGHPEPIISWKKNGVPISAENGHYEFLKEKLLVAHAQKSDAGAYSCLAVNQVGEHVSRAAMVTVFDPLDTRQKERGRPKDVTKGLMDIRVCLVNVTIVPSAPAVHLHWKVTPTSQPIETYKVFYHSLLPTKLNWAEWDVPRDQQTIIPGLERGYTYEFKVRPYLGKIHGVDSNVRQLYIPEEVPSAAPQIISITVSRSGNSTVTLHWEPPPPDTHNGIIKAYQVWFLGNETHPGFNRTVDGDTYSLETIGLPSGHKYCVKVAAINGAGVGVASNPVCGTADPVVEKMAKSSDFLSANYMLEVVRQPVFIASVGSALWIMLMVLAVYVCQQQARQFGGGRRYALGEGLYRNASDDTIIKHRIESSDSPWLSNTWKSTSGSKNYSTSSSLSSQLLWMESKDSQEFHKSTVSFDRQSQGSRIQTVPLVPDSSNNIPHGALCVNLPAKDLKAFYSSLPYLSNPNLQSMELTQAGELMSHGSQNLRTDCVSGQGRTHQGPWKAAGSLSPNRTIRGSWAKYDKKELHQVHSTPMSPSGFSADWSNHSSPRSVVSSRKHQRIHGRAKKVLKTYSSSKFSLCSSQSGPSLPPPPPIPPGFQALQDSSTKQECSCTCYLDPPEDFMNQQVDKESLKMVKESLDEHQSFPTLPYNQLPTASCSVPVSLSDDQETILTPEEVAEYLEFSTETDCQREPDDSDSTTSHILFPSHSYGYICGPLAIELLENDGLDEDEDPNMVEDPCPSTKFFRSSCQTPSSSLSEDETSLGGSLVNGWGSVSEDNGTSTRCSLVSSSDGSFLLDANFAQALAVAVDSFCFGLTKKEVDRPLTDFLPPVSPLDGLLHPQALVKSSEEVQRRLGSQPLPVWEWSTDWVEEMEAKYMQPAENWEAVFKPGEGRIAAPEEAQQVSASIQQGTNDKCCCSKVEGHLPGMLK